MSILELKESLDLKWEKKSSAFFVLITSPCRQSFENKRNNKVRESLSFAYFKIVGYLSSLILEKLSISYVTSFLFTFVFMLFTVTHTIWNEKIEAWVNLGQSSTHKQPNILVHHKLNLCGCIYKMTFAYICSWTAVRRWYIIRELSLFLHLAKNMINSFTGLETMWATLEGYSSVVAFIQTL